MNSAQFSVYKGHYLAAIRQVLAKAEPGRLDEIAFPAYTHANSLISRLFWKRLHIVINYI